MFTYLLSDLSFLYSIVIGNEWKSCNKTEDCCKLPCASRYDGLRFSFCCKNILLRIDTYQARAKFGRHWVLFPDILEAKTYQESVEIVVALAKVVLG